MFVQVYTSNGDAERCNRGGSRVSTTNQVESGFPVAALFAEKPLILQKVLVETEIR